MREGTFTEALEVDLSVEEQALRGRQAARQALAIKAYKAETERLEEDWKETKKSRKTGEEERVADLYKTSQAAETGREEREVECEEVLVGAMVETRRKGGARHGEHVSARPATKDELVAADRAKEKKAKAMSAEELGAKLRAGIAKLCKSARDKVSIAKNLGKEIREATPKEIDAAIEAEIARGSLIEPGDNAGRFVWVDLGAGGGPAN
jgi:hypothetical protein